MQKYQELLRDPRWQKKRLQILDRDNWTCKVCGNKDRPLNIHHLKYSKGLNPWEYENQYLVTVCEKCHICADCIYFDFPHCTVRDPEDIKFERGRCTDRKTA